MELTEEEIELAKKVKQARLNVGKSQSQLVKSINKSISPSNLRKAEIKVMSYYDIDGDYFYPMAISRTKSHLFIKTKTLMHYEQFNRSLFGMHIIIKIAFARTLKMKLLDFFPRKLVLYLKNCALQGRGNEVTVLDDAVAELYGIDAKTFKNFVLEQRAGRKEDTQ